jgi:hypothetical protein
LTKTTSTFLLLYLRPQPPLSIYTSSYLAMSDSDSDERLDYRTNPLGSLIIFSSNIAEATSPLCERNVQVYRAPDLEGTLYYYRTNIQAPPYQVRLHGNFDHVCMTIATLASDDTILKTVARCMCEPCIEDVTWADPEPLSCSNCSETCRLPTCSGYRVCRFHFCTCDTYGRYNLRSGRR